MILDISILIDTWVSYVEILVISDKWEHSKLEFNSAIGGNYLFEPLFSFPLPKTI